MSADPRYLAAALALAERGRATTAPAPWKGRLSLAALRLCAALPLPWALAVGRLLGRLMWRFAKRNRLFVECNLALCLPELSAPEREALGREAMENLGMTFAEAAAFWLWPKHKLDRIPVDVVADLPIAVRAVESVDEILRQLGDVRPVRTWCRVSLVVPDPELSGALEIEGTRPVWLVESMSRDGDSGRPVMCSKAWTRTDAANMVVELDEKLS